jgi:hypothetical protein
MGIHSMGTTAVRTVFTAVSKRCFSCHPFYTSGAWLTTDGVPCPLTFCLGTKHRRGPFPFGDGGQKLRKLGELAVSRAAARTGRNYFAPPVVRK